MKSLVRASRTATDVFDVIAPSQVPLTVEAGAYRRAGQAAGPAPMELMLASLVTCAGATIDEVLTKMRFPAVALNVVADADRADSVPRVYTRIALEFHVAVEAPTDRVDRAVDITERTCSASAMLTRVTEVLPRAIHVREVEATVTRPLRQAILRPHQTLEELVAPGETADGAAWFAAFDRSDVVGTVGLVPEGSPDGGPRRQVRLRSMTTTDAMRGRGLGRVLLAAALDRAWTAGVERVWCSARTAAVGFYERAGFHPTSEEYEVDVIGSHVRMAIDRP